MAYVARRLAEDGVLRDGITVERAADVLWMVCSFEAFDQLHSDRGLSVDEAIDVIVTTAEAALCRPRRSSRRTPGRPGGPDAGATPTRSA